MLGVQEIKAFYLMGIPGLLQVPGSGVLRSKNHALCFQASNAENISILGSGFSGFFLKSSDEFQELGCPGHFRQQGLFGRKMSEEIRIL